MTFTTPYESRTLPDGTVEKRCSKCGEWKPATREYFAPNKGGFLGLRPDCKPCVVKASREYSRTRGLELNREAQRKFRAEHPERARELDRKYREVNHPPSAHALELRERRENGLRQCCDCKQIFPATNEYFPASTTQPLGIGYRCHACNRINAQKQAKRAALRAP